MANLDNGVILGALGSAIIKAAGGTVTPPSGMVIATIQFGVDVTPSALVAEIPGKYFNTAHAAQSGGTHTSTDGTWPSNGLTVEEGTGGQTAADVKYTAGTTIYGRWTSCTIPGVAAGSFVIFYFGY